MQDFHNYTLYFDLKSKFTQLHIVYQILLQHFVLGVTCKGIKMQSEFNYVDFNKVVSLSVLYLVIVCMCAAALFCSKDTCNSGSIFHPTSEVYPFLSTCIFSLLATGKIFLSPCLFHCSFIVFCYALFFMSLNYQHRTNDSCDHVRCSWAHFQTQLFYW
jgi:hypothetical protein